MAQFVLVHGGWHGGWCFSRVSKILREQGHDVFTPTLTGLGERRHLANPGVTLSTHIEDVVNVIEFEALDQIVLFGHSYAGMVISGVASELGSTINSLFYLDGFLPEDGQALTDLIDPDMRDGIFRSVQDGMAPSLPAELFVSEADRPMVDRLLTPHPILTFCDPIRLSGREWEVPHRFYLMTEGNHRTKPTFEKVRADPRWRTGTIGGMHDVMLDRPADLADLLLAEVTDPVPVQG